MNKFIINILLFSALVIGSIGLITFDVWADDIAIFSGDGETETVASDNGSTSDVDVSIPRPSYVPDNYKYRTYTLQFGYTSQVSNGVNNTSYYFDWSIWFPEQYDIVPCLSRGSRKVGGGWYYTLSSSFYLYNPNTYNYTYIHVANGMPGDKYTYSCSIDGNDVKIYSYVNESFESTTFKSLKKNEVSNNTNTIKDIAANPYNYLSYFDSSYSKLDSYQLSFNDYYLHQDYSGYTDLMGGRLGENYFYRSDKGDKNADMQNALKILESYRASGDVVYSSPKMSSCSLAGNTLIMKYYYDTEKPVPSHLYTYKDIFVKIKGVSNWINCANALEDNKYILTLKDNSSSSCISGVLNIDILKDIVAAQQEKETDDIDIQAVIWGVQYGYKKAGAVFSQYAYVRTDFEFSRYVFQNASDDEDYNFSVGDLGNLGNLGTSGSTTIIGGTPNAPSGGNGSNNVWTDSSSGGGLSSITDWVKNFKFDFSAITGAIQGSFSLVTSFASLIGNIFQNFFGEAVGVVALLAIGICVVLRLVGR